MKTTIIPFLFLIFFSFSGLAQSERGQKIKALKTAFITQELNLSPAEAEKFWPVYNQFDHQLWTLKSKERKELTEAMQGSIDNLTEKEASALLDKINALHKKQFLIHQEMDAQLIKQLSPIKLLKLKKAEKDFKMQLLRKYKHGLNKRK